MRHRGITFQIFTVTTVLLVVSALLIYLTLYFMLPSYYKSIKQSRLDSGVDKLVTAIDGKSYSEAEALMLEFGRANNAVLFLRDENGTIIPVNLVPFAGGYMGDSAFPRLRKLMQNQDWGERWSDPPGGPGEPGGAGLRGGDRNRTYTVSRTIHFTDSTDPFTILVDAPLQPVDEASEVILRFLPYMLIAILFIAIGGAAIYSRLIAKPLLGLNLVARRMAKLDFKVAEKTLERNDEIGELSRSLSKLAINLRSTMAELQDANAQLKDDIEREREHEAKRREFVATISHELKTPITAVSGQLEAMIGNVGAFKDRDTYLRQSYKIMREMDKLVHEILDLSKLESRDFLPLMREIDLTELVCESIDSVSYLAEVKGMAIEYDMPQEAIVIGDERLLAKAVSNIVCNAVQYSGDGERVVVRLTELAGMDEAGMDEAPSLPQNTGDKAAPGSGARLRLEVLNTGVQLDETKLPRLFEPFYRAEQSRSRTTGGSGLGLYIVSKVLDAHGAEYGIENTPEGVKFIMVLQAA
ncbi:HAMP domain-containing histidine kinase [Paenibacillus sp. sptzw28]|uniref:sensor histidine kinase n=1 Tax=Paenibacillus sp. sptzw28 TaxID=715179 RepID=UPI001C6F173C|nr:HAMP domain-containing sensor histidine kinase [Paenibacillus sp. sptzw28]QYR21343.1 HAMP domain-containing histidine kinase [Paenibacillus sp. sptzw28]